MSTQWVEDLKAMSKTQKVITFMLLLFTWTLTVYNMAWEAGRMSALEKAYEICRKSSSECGEV
jgi:hypothetical protein